MVSSSNEQPQQMNSLFSENPLAETTAIDSICIGSGRFLRAVLVPALVASGYHPAIIQPRKSRSFLDYSLQAVSEQQQGSSNNVDGIGSWTYEVDTVNFDGSIETGRVPCWGAGTLGSPEGKRDVLDLCARLSLDVDKHKPLIIGLGVTEAGLASSSTDAMKHLYDILVTLANAKQISETPKKICVINTDNVSQNGNTIRRFMEELVSTQTDTTTRTTTSNGQDADNDNDNDNDSTTRTTSMKQFLTDSVVFHNTMVDRITSQRPGSNGLVPRAEPTPLKALVIEDLGSTVRLAPSLRGDKFRKRFGVVIRDSAPGQLDADIALKLRVANGTHTAVAHTMALAGLAMTDVLSSKTSRVSKLLMNYLDSFFEHQIKMGVGVTQEFSATSTEAKDVYEDWRKRLIHAHFGLSTFFITQNGAAKGGIRIGPTIKDLVSHNLPVTCSTAFALAAILRFLTPVQTNATGTAGPVTPTNGIYRGWLDRSEYEKRKVAEIVTKQCNESKTTVSYADGLSYNLEEGWYEFRCACNIAMDGSNNNGNANEQPLPEILAATTNDVRDRQPVSYESVVKAYLQKDNGGNLSAVAHTDAFAILTKAVSTLYARMVAGDGMIDILSNLDLEASCDCLVDDEL